MLGRTALCPKLNCVPECSDGVLASDAVTVCQRTRQGSPPMVPIERLIISTTDP